MSSSGVTNCIKCLTLKKKVIVVCFSIWLRGKLEFVWDVGAETLAEAYLRYQEFNPLKS